jgi:hypothetical protein
LCAVCGIRGADDVGANAAAGIAAQRDASNAATMGMLERLIMSTYARKENEEHADATVARARFAEAGGTMSQ